MQKPAVVILGVDHKIQQRKGPCSIYAAKQAEFLVTLSSLQAFHSFELIAEELVKPSSTLARVFCEERCIKYQLIDIDEDIKAKIEHVPGGLVYDDLKSTYEPSEYPQYQAAWILIREFHMFKTFIKHMNAAR